VTPIPFLSPTFPDPADVALDYAAIVERGIFSNKGPLEVELTSRLERWVGAATKVAVVSSGTAGLYLAVSTTFRTDRRIAVVPSFTFPAGPLVLRSLGFDIAFVEIDRASWQPDLDQVQRFLGERATDTAGILLTATFGVANADIASWEELAAEHDLPLVVDSAAGFGSRYASGEAVGSRGTCEVFSFHATKVLAVGEAGAVSSSDCELIAEINKRKNFGFDEHRESVSPGTNAKVPELSCAIGLRQLDVLAQRIAQRQVTFDLYRRRLAPLGFEFQPLAEHAALPFVSALSPDGVDRDLLMAALEDDGIGCRCYYNPPVHRQAVFRDAEPVGSLAVTDDFAGSILSLPLSDHFPEQGIARIGSIFEQVMDVAAMRS
jgi:dTDP-4-amino-4,6-dideoxygalactose transaminase